MTVIKIGLLGLGTVGSGIVELLQSQAAKFEHTRHVHFQLKTVAVAHLDQTRSIKLPTTTVLTDQIATVTTDPEIQIVIEVMGTIEPAKQAIRQAILHGKSVITANKDLIALHGSELISLAKNQRVDLLYEASVAGGIPILRTLSDSLITDQVEQVTGVINGTTNYILSAMAKQGTTYTTALHQAQDLGYAEADPTNDVQGLDATYKLMILSQFAFGQTLQLNQVTSNGITEVSAIQLQSAQKLGLTIKHLAVARKVNDQLFTTVTTMAINSQNPLANINDVQNAIAVKSQALGETLYTGAGAGAKPTANSVLSDLLAAATNLQQDTCGQAFNRYHAELKPATLSNVPQQYLISIDQLQNTMDIVNEVPTNNWLKQVSGQHYWAGLSKVLSVSQRNHLISQLREIIGKKAPIQFLPIANSWQFSQIAAPISK